jgi:hypothetical protein
MLSALLLMNPQSSGDTTISKDMLAEVWIIRPADKKGGLLVAGGVAGMILGGIVKSPEAGPSAGFYIGLPLIAVGAYVQQHARPKTLIYARSGQHEPLTGRDWRDVQALRAGTSIKLIMNAGDVEGTFVAANADELVIHLKRGNFSVDRTNVKRLDRRLPGSNRGRNIGRGIGWGLAAGVLRSAVACEGCSAFGGSLITSQSMVLGAIFGAASPAVRWDTVYQR